ncbi:MAG: Allantoicase [Pycnora praestabilis]|nr:MAG: Allantoicase [Pycnora praestabilis]
MEEQALSPEVIQDTMSISAQSIAPEYIQQTFASNSIDLISKPLGSRILSFSDEWFASASNLTTPTPPICRPGVFTHAGAWYDGWETRRHNSTPFDWVIIRLGVASGKVKGVEIDTAFFNGNHAPAIAVQGCFIGNDEEVQVQHFQGWETILGKQKCGPSQRQAWQLAQRTEKAYTHVRLLMFPDGGIARFRLFGTAVPIFPNNVDEVFDLAAAVNGGVAIACSDQHFGTRENLLLPGRGVDMGDGWETKRSREKGHVDWVIVRLGTVGEVQKIVVDTAHFRGNFPQSIRVEGIQLSTEPAAGDEAWAELLTAQKCGPDVEHVFAKEILKNIDGKMYSHIKLIIIPDGGVKRFRVIGKRAA